MLRKIKTWQEKKNKESDQDDPILTSLSFVEHKDEKDEDDDEAHPDERWLISYADMMTLLFGLFVLLFSLQSPEQLEKMKESVKKQFGQEQKSNHDIKEQEEKNAEIKEVKPPEISNEVWMERLKELQTSWDQDKEQLAAVQSQWEHTIKKVQELEKQLKVYEKRWGQEQHSKKEEPEKNWQRNVAAVQDQLQKVEQERNHLENELKKALAQNKSLSSQKHFVAVVISWPTVDHDLDLKIKDPKGKIFSYKKREYPNYPGQFSLDTRRGPGVEVWQSDDIFPGTYEVQITFYNSYNNLSDAKVSTVIFSSFGKVEFKPQILDMKTHSSVTLRFQMDQEGQVKVLGSSDVGSVTK